MMDIDNRQQAGLKRIGWDGECLTVWPSPGTASIDVELDGQHFARLDARAASASVLQFPYSPNGARRMQLRFRIDRGARTAPVAVELDRRGIAAATTPASLQHLPGSELVDCANCRTAFSAELAIVVPVYNAAPMVQRCLDSVLRHSSGPARLIVIDDASSDPDVAPLLARYSGLNNVSVLRNERNLGFTATVNRGMALADRADVVLLNADTEVAAQWLSGLRRAVHASADTGSATAVSDNAGAFSVPELEQENPLPDNWTFEQTARALWQHAGTAYPRLPTGNGFCMVLRRAALDAVGLFDAEAFAEGYGEENDWSQRAAAAGWRHAIAGNVLVRHARSTSFGHERRAALGARGMQVLRERWPNYEADVGSSLYSFERLVLDWRARRIYADAHATTPRARWLCAEPDAAALIAEANCEVWRWRGVAHAIDLEAHADNGRWRSMERHDGDRADGDAPPIAPCWTDWLQQHAIEAVVDGPQVAAPAELLEAARCLGVAVAQGVSARGVLESVQMANAALRSFSDVEH